MMIKNPTHDDFIEALERFSKAEDKWLDMQSRWLDDHKPVFTPETRAAIDKADKLKEQRMFAARDDLRQIANKLGGEYARVAAHHLGKNFG